MKLLFVEPDEYYHSQFADQLGHLGDMSFVTTGAAVRDSVRQNLPDVAVLELLLPDAPGFAVLEHLRTAAPNALLLVFSRAGHLDDVKAALGHGVAGYFVKGQDTINDIKKLLLNYV